MAEVRKTADPKLYTVFRKAAAKKKGEDDAE